MSISLSGTFEVVKILKKTQARTFKDLKVGDVFVLEYDLNGRYNGAPKINVYKGNELKNSVYSKQLKETLYCFELKELFYEI